MGLRANPRLIGAFVLGGIILAIMAVFIFSSGGVLSRRTPAVAFFQGSVAGLQIGAPVTFRGVRVGAVTAMRLRFDSEARRTSIPVFMEFEESAITVVGAAEVPTIDELVKRGLRARLTQMSFITGQLMVELDFDRSEDAFYGGLDLGIDEIPTLKSSIDQVRERLESLPIDELAGALTASAVALEKLLNSPELPRLLSDTSKAAASIQQLSDTLNRELPGLLSDARKTTQAAGATMEDVRRTLDGLGGDVRTLLRHSDGELLALSAQGKQTLKTLETTLREAQGLLASGNSLIASGTPQRYDIDQMLRGLSAAARSLKGFAETLERNPNSLLVGKREPR
jgi:paraquat-inducible protein B